MDMDGSYVEDDHDGSESGSGSEILSDSQFDSEEDERELDEFAELEAAAVVGGILPYQFEPQFAEGEADERVVEGGGGEEDVDAENRLGNNDWCSCGGCEVMQTVKESVCCKEVEKVVTVMDECDENDNLDCIIEHPGFSTVCLDKYVLDTAYYQYRQQYGNTARDDATVDERYRHVAYRQMSRWCWGFLGHHVRVPLPSCAVAKIRQTFPPAALDEFTGFQDP